LLRADGFTDVRYVDEGTGPDTANWLAHGELDFDYNFPPAHILSIEAGAPIKVLTGVHSGCLELVVSESIHNVTDLKGKRLGVHCFTKYPDVLATLVAAYVGLDLDHDIQWVTSPDISAMQFFVDGKIEGYFAIPPDPQELRARKIGHTILSIAVDHPWSQYFCCMLSASADYVNKYPVATKRVVRAILKAADLCVSNPKWAAQQLVDGGITDRYEIAVASFDAVRFDKWREFDPEDTLRFYGLRMHEGGLIKSDPKKIIAQGTDWRFLNELRQELKG
jgi:NitT/TauT family transport system substrate-binding protein